MVRPWSTRITATLLPSAVCLFRCYTRHVVRLLCRSSRAGIRLTTITLPDGSRHTL